MTTKHTPWTAYGSIVYFANNTGGFDIRNCPDPEDKARLIASAPDLLEAADAAWQCIAELAPTQARVEVAQMLQAAIAKARGEA